MDIVDVGSISSANLVGLLIFYSFGEGSIILGGINNHQGVVGWHGHGVMQWSGFKMIGGEF